MKPKLLLDLKNFNITIQRLCRQVMENHGNFSDSVIVGLQPRGIYLAKRIQNLLAEILPGKKIPCGNLDITFFRDDFRQHENPLLASKTEIDFITENKNVILVDDVLFTGRTVRAAMDALQQFGRPSKIELLVLIDRRFSRQLPVEANYVGKAVDTITSQKVKVNWNETDGEDSVWLV